MSGSLRRSLQPSETMEEPADQSAWAALLDRAGFQSRSYSSLGKSISLRLAVQTNSGNRAQEFPSPLKALKANWPLNFRRCKWLKKSHVINHACQNAQSLANINFHILLSLKFLKSKTLISLTQPQHRAKRQDPHFFYLIRLLQTQSASHSND